MRPEHRRITNPKVAGLEPVWRPYAGVSVLFDNPGPTPRARGGLRPLTVPRAGDAPLYDAIGAAVAALGAARAPERFGYCPLPPSTYHVTVCDGVNQTQTGRLPRRAAASVRRYLTALPGALPEPPPALAFLARTGAFAAAGGRAVEFRATGLAGWGSVLAVRLEPLPESRDALALVAEARARLAATVEARLGLRVQPWRPHLSVGYFADRDGAAAARAEIPAWSDAVRREAGDATVRFASASLYGFTDMVTFFRTA